MSMLVSRIGPPLVAFTGFFALYSMVLASLVRDWMNDGNYSHGFLIVPLAGYFVWERRAKLAELPTRPTWAGLPVIAASIGVLVLGLLGAELFLSRISILGVLAGAIVFVLGWAHLRALLFPLLFLLLMIPIPAIIFNQIAVPLQLVASRFGEATLSAAGIPVLREGNIIVLAHTTLEVAEACSGIRSLISLLTLGIVYGYFSDRRASVRVALALATIPIAIVAGTGIAAHYYGVAAAEGFFHSFSGWAVFAVAFLFLFLVLKAIARLVPEGRRLAAVEATL
jgi:exosortase